MNDIENYVNTAEVDVFVSILLSLKVRAGRLRLLFHFSEDSSMNRDLLTLLGCSGSLLVALSGSPAKAILPPGAMDNTKIDLQPVSQPIVQQEAPQTAAQATSDRVKQLAASVFGCTCTNCLNAVRQMVQQGTLSL